MSKTENSLEIELKTYNGNKKSLLEKASGKFVLVKGEEIIGTFENETDAYNMGYKMFKNGSFLVKEILEVENVVDFHSNFIKL